jgi:hypothetical protein
MNTDRSYIYYDKHKKQYPPGQMKKHIRIKERNGLKNKTEDRNNILGRVMPGSAFF